MKNIKCIYESYIPKIIRNNNGIKYNLSEENIFGNLNYSMNKNLLKGKTIEIDSASLYKRTASSSLPSIYACVACSNSSSAFI